jgi:CBS domain-containing protein
MLNFRRKRRIKGFFDMKKSVASIARKSVVYCPKDTKISDVLDVMFSSGFRRIPIVSRNRELAGLATAVDFLNYLYGRGRTPLNVPVGRVMEKKVYALDRKHNIGRAVELFKTYRRGGYPVLNGKKLEGMVTDFDFLKQIYRPVTAAVSELMVHKPIVTRESHSVREAAHMIVKGGFRRLPVVRDGILVGVVTPYDILVHLKDMRFRGYKKDRAKVKEIMRENPFHIEPESNVFDAIKLMKDRMIGGLPVTEDHEVVGIITERDILEAI